MIQENFQALVENILNAQEYLSGGPMTEVSYYNDETAKQLIMIRQIMLSQHLEFKVEWESKIILLLSDSMAAVVTKDMEDEEFALRIKVAHDLASTSDLIDFYSRNK